jgi:hypothetical protein
MEDFIIKLVTIWGPAYIGYVAWYWEWSKNVKKDERNFEIQLNNTKILAGIESLLKAKPRQRK